MPCRSYEQDEWEFSGRHKLLDDLARMLCGLCERSSEVDISAVKGLSKWWEDHQEADRKAAEAKLRAQREERNRKEKQYLKLKRELGK